MAEITGKQKRLRRAFSKLKELNTTQAMKKNVGGFNPYYNSNPTTVQGKISSPWDNLSEEISTSANNFSTTVQGLQDSWQGPAALKQQ